VSVVGYVREEAIPRGLELLSSLRALVSGGETRRTRRVSRKLAAALEKELGDLIRIDGRSANSPWKAADVARYKRAADAWDYPPDTEYVWAAYTDLAWEMLDRGRASNQARATQLRGSAWRLAQAAVRAGLPIALADAPDVRPRDATRSRDGRAGVPETISRFTMIEGGGEGDEEVGEEGRASGGARPEREEDGWE
jgi:hypothetical protein